MSATFEDYSFILTQPKRVVLKRENGERSYKLRAKYEVVLRGHQRDPRHRGKVFNEDTRQWEPAPPPFTTILLLNKQISKEATPVLYEENVFDFKDAVAMGTFVRQIGGGTLYLRYMELAMDGFQVGSSDSAAQYAFHITAAECHNLRSLTLYDGDVCEELRKQGIDKLANGMRYLMRSLEVSYGDKKLSCSPLDVVEIVCTPCLKCEKDWRQEDKIVHGDLGGR